MQKFSLKSLFTISFLAAGALMSAAAVPAPSTTVCGIMVSNDDWTPSSPESGVYNIQVIPGGQITKQYSSPAMAEVLSGLKKDNVVYTIEATASGRYYYRQMNASDWSTIGSRQEIDVENAAADLCYDPVTGKAYGSFWRDTYQGFANFGSFDLSTAEATYIDKVQRDERDIFALAADSKGTIYCLFGSYNYLATLDPATGQVNRIKTTGLEPATNFAEARVNSMCYDEENDRLIASIYEEEGWGANKTHKSGLFIINPHTGDVEKVMSFPGSACFAALHVVDAVPDPAAPGSPRNVKVSLDRTGLSGTVSFIAPTVSFGGEPLSGSMMALISINGTESVIENITPGQAVTSPSLSFVQGENTVRVIMASEEFRGGSEVLYVWGGEDIPLPVTDVELSVADGTATLTWKEPVAGEHDGILNAENLRYRIVRMPENRTVAEAATGSSFTDSDLDPSYRSIYYTVTAYNSTGSAPAVQSNFSTTESFTVPFAEGFNTPDDFALWTIENVNGGSTWEYNTTNKAATYEYDPDKQKGDDWLISPPIRLHAGKAYKLSYSWRVMMKAYPESFEVWLGDAPDSKSMTESLATHLKVSNTSFQSADKAFSVDKDGDYFIGVHEVSDPYMYILLIDDILIDEIDNRVPASVEDLTVIPAAQGVRSALVRFTVPDKDQQGGSLTSVTKATISRNGVTIAELTDVAPGKQMEYNDTGISADGVQKYSVSCSNSNGDGVAAYAEAYVGIDAPGAVGSLTIAEVAGHPYLSWEAPVEGVNGGWFDADAVTYRIVRSDGQVVAENCAETRFTDQSYTSPSKGQDAIWYLVTPYVGTLKGAYAQSELLLCGQPYTTPATETFANAEMKYYPWISQSSNAVNYAWTLDNMGYNPQVADQNGDRGLATFHSVGEPVGTVSYFYSPKFDISSLDNPVVSFWLYHAPGEGDGRVELLVADGGDTFRPLGSEAIARTSSTGWTRHSVSLGDCKSAPWVRIGFKATGDGTADIYLDNFEIGNQLVTDLALTALSLPLNIAAGEDIHGVATVLNAGVNDVASAGLKISDGKGTQLASVDITDLKSGNETLLPFEIPASAVGRLDVKAEIIIDGDGNLANNSASGSVNIVEAKVNAPANLRSSEGDDGIVLTWDAPASDGIVTDDVEAYEDFAIDGIGQWTMWDGDYDVTYAISNGVDYPHASDRKAFQVCNADVLGINIWDEGKPHSGKKMFMALCSYNYVNNDWLISPELNGTQQWISFFARSFTLQNTPAERMRVWYSDIDNDPANFTEITSSYVELPGSWMRYSYYLPEGAKYFAVNCVSDGAFAMFIDDISYNDLTVPTWKIDHYDIYRNNEKIGESVETFYLIGSQAEGADFSVKAVYDRGESPMSASLYVGPGAVGTIHDGSIGIEARNGEIIIRGAEGHPVQISSISGMMLYNGISDADELRLNATPGIYIVRTSASATKLIIE